MRIGDDFVVNFCFVADGWPLRLVASHKLNEKVSLLSFYRVRHFWHDLARTKKCLLIGHSPSELANINEWILKSGYPQFETLVDGFRELEELETIIENLNHGGIDIIFLALSPAEAGAVNGETVTFGGYSEYRCLRRTLVTRGGYEYCSSHFLSNLGIYGLVRSWRSPRRLYLGTVGALMPLLRNLLRD